jgi:hypothetical protein
MTRSRRTLTLVTLGAFLTLAGCASRQPAPAPAPPPRALQITAQRRQSQAQQDRDKADCQSMASSQATSSETWAQMFVACMSGRGYRVDEAYGR